MEQLAIILGIIFAPALWQYFPKLLEVLFKGRTQSKKELREAEIQKTKELKEDGIAFRQYLLDENKNLQAQMQILISSNETLSKQLTEVKAELDATVKLLETKDKLIVDLTAEVTKLKNQVQILNDVLKK